MRSLGLLLLVAVVAGVSPAPAEGKAKGGKRAPAPRTVTAETKADEAVTPAEPRSETKATPAKTPKSKVYTFSGLDVEGKLKTPQLLYFLNRVKLELDTTSPEKRSFLKELEKSSDDKGL